MASQQKLLSPKDSTNSPQDMFWRDFLHSRHFCTHVEGREKERERERERERGIPKFQSSFVGERVLYIEQLHATSRDFRRDYE